jgi:hypothetical protein
MWQSLVTLLSVLVGAALAYAAQRAQASKSQKQQWSDRAAETLADVEMFLTDANPKRVVLLFDPVGTMALMDGGTMALMDDLRDRLPSIRREVSVLGVGHPEAVVRRKSRELQAALFREFAQLGWLVNAKLRDVSHEKDHLI